MVETNKGFWKAKKVIVTGGTGFLGSHLAPCLRDAGASLFIPRRTDYDLRYDVEVEDMFTREGRPDVLFHLAANVGGIGYNRQYPYTLLYDNLIMGLNLIQQSVEWQIPKFVCVGTVCAYPRLCPVPFREDHLWSGYPEPTNAPYGLAKKMLLVALQAARQELGFNGIFLLPTNLYGPGDRFDPERSHVIPALIRKFVEGKERNAPEVVAWGRQDDASRDFLYVEDCAEGLMLAAEKYEGPDPVNLGSGRETRIAVLAHMIQQAVGYRGGVSWDESRPSGQPRRKLDTSRALRTFGWQATTELSDGLKRTIEWYLEHRMEADGVED